MPIPKTIHQIWLGSPIPVHLQRYVDGWRDLHPQWKFIWWTEDNLPVLPPDIQSLYDDAPRLWPDRRQYQFRSDLLRYIILEQYGGVYVDTDFECQKPIDDLLIGCRGFFAWEADNKWLGNSIIGAEKNSQFLDALLGGLLLNVSRGKKGDTPAKLSGPQYVTRIFNDLKPEGWAVYPSKLFYPYSWGDLSRGRKKFPDAYAIHHWENRRTLTGTPR